MFIYKRKIFLKDTDVTGVIYFGALLQYALEAFEVFLHGKDMGLNEILSQGYLLPIVHAEADYKAPLRVGEEICIEISLSAISERSFSIQALMTKTPSKILAGKTKLVHAFVLQGSEKASAIPLQFSSFLKEHLQAE